MAPLYPLGLLKNLACLPPQGETIALEYHSDFSKNPSTHRQSDIKHERERERGRERDQQYKVDLVHYKCYDLRV
jgi:hypothetical protein